MLMILCAPEMPVKMGETCSLASGSSNLLPEFKLRNNVGVSRFKIAKRIFVTNTAVHISV
jgi:hypothetical protein